VIGSGPGGYVAAIRAAKRGGKVQLVEMDEVGGTCLNRGCIPSKTLLAGASRLLMLKKSSAWGITAPGGFSFDWNTLVRHKDKVVAGLRRGIEYLLKKNGITLIRGRGILNGPGCVKVQTPEGSRDLNCCAVILASGSRSLDVSAFPADHERIITSDDALSLKTLPESLIIVGGGVIGCEFASLFTAFGVRVTLVEALPRLLGVTDIDDEIAQRLEQIMKKSGVTLALGTPLVRIVTDRRETGVTAVLADGREYNADKALVAVGRRAVSEGLGLESVALQPDRRGFLSVDDHMRTEAPGIYAIGDLNGRWQLAHAASFQGIIAADDAMGHEAHPMIEAAVPSCIFTIPPIAAVGMSAGKARENGIHCEEGIFPYRALGKAAAMDEMEGIVKVIVEKESGRILGANILGEGAPEMIHELALAIRRGLTAADVMETVHAHPTFSEAIPEAVEAIFGLGIHA